MEFVAYLQNSSNKFESHFSFGSSSCVPQVEEWTQEEDQVIAYAVAHADRKSINLFDELVKKIPRKTATQVIKRYFTKGGALDCFGDDDCPMPTHEDDSPVKILSEVETMNQLSSVSNSSVWSLEEHKMFLRGLSKAGNGNWPVISQLYVKTKNAAEVASYGQRYFKFLRETNGGNNKNKIADQLILMEESLQSDQVTASSMNISISGLMTSSTASNYTILPPQSSAADTVSSQVNHPADPQSQQCLMPPQGSSSQKNQVDLTTKSRKRQTIVPSGNNKTLANDSGNGVQSKLQRSSFCVGQVTAGTPCQLVLTSSLPQSSSGLQIQKPATDSDDVRKSASMESILAKLSSKSSLRASALNAIPPQQMKRSMNSLSSFLEPRSPRRTELPMAVSQSKVSTSLFLTPSLSSNFEAPKSRTLPVVQESLTSTTPYKSTLVSSFWQSSADIEPHSVDSQSFLPSFSRPFSTNSEPKNPTSWLSSPSRSSSSLTSMMNKPDRNSSNFTASLSQPFWSNDARQRHEAQPHRVMPPSYHKSLYNMPSPMPIANQFSNQPYGGVPTRGLPMISETMPSKNDHHAPLPPSLPNFSWEVNDNSSQGFSKQDWFNKPSTIASNGFTSGSHYSGLPNINSGSAIENQLEQLLKNAGLSGQGHDPQMCYPYRLFDNNQLQASNNTTTSRANEGFGMQTTMNGGTTLNKNNSYGVMNNNFGSTFDAVGSGGRVLPDSQVNYSFTTNQDPMESSSYSNWLNEIMAPGGSSSGNQAFDLPTMNDGALLDIQFDGLVNDSDDMVNTLLNDANPYESEYHYPYLFDGGN